MNKSSRILLFLITCLIMTCLPEMIFCQAESSILHNSKGYHPSGITKAASDEESDNDMDIEGDSEANGNDGEDNNGDGNDGDGNDGEDNNGDGNDGDGNDGDGNDGDGNDGDGNDDEDNNGDGNGGDRNEGDDENKLKEVLGYGLPVVVINTIDGEEPTFDRIDCPEGCMGVGITNATKVPGEVVVYDIDGSPLYDSGNYENKESGMTVKIRGNTSAYLVKKPFKIKLQKKGDMLGRGDKKYNDKNWLLINGYSLKTYLGYKISELLEQSWTPAGFFVNLVFNDDFRGLYYLQESVERNEKCRIDVDEDGFVMEHDPYWWNEGGEWLESEDGPRYNYTFKYPDYEDASLEHISAIQNILREYETSVKAGDYPDYIEVSSFVNWILAHDILGTSDGGGVNLYLTKKSVSDTSKIECGPIWDFDSSERNIDSYSQVHMGRFAKFFYNKNNTFSKVYVARWKEMRERIIEGMDSLIEDLRTPAWDGYRMSVAKSNERWPSEKESSIEIIYNRVKNYYPHRFEWLDTQIADMEEAIKKEDFLIGWDPILNVLDFKLVGNVLRIEEDVEALQISGIDGSVIYNGSVSEGTEVELASGLWILRTHNKVSKVMVK